MPWTLPLSVVAGCSCRRGRRPRSGRSACRGGARELPWPRPIRREAVIAAEHERQCRRRAYVSRLVVERLADRRSPRCTCLGSPSRVSGVGVTMSPSSIAPWPSAASRSSRPAIRTADGPMSTPRRPPPRSSGTPMMGAGSRPSPQVPDCVFVRHRNAFAGRRDDRGEETGCVRCD